jgi:hypothetical protein
LGNFFIPFFHIFHVYHTRIFRQCSALPGEAKMMYYQQYHIEAKAKLYYSNSYDKSAHCR